VAAVTGHHPSAADGSLPDDASTGVLIGANSVLPAQREAITLRTSDGLALVGELAVPVDHPPSATVICVHPLPTHGGMMDSHVLRKMAWRLPAMAGIAVLRFNTRGTTSAAGTSQGSFDHGNAEGLDLDAAIAFAAQRGLPDPWLLGWSFGTDVILRHGNHPPVAGAVLLSPPLRTTTEQELQSWMLSGRPLVCIIPEFDEYLPAEPARARFSVVPQARVVIVAEGQHLWVGERFVAQVLDQVVAAVNPSAAPLPRTWSGPMTRWSDL